jgi:hypothetical protein
MLVGVNSIGNKKKILLFLSVSVSNSSQYQQEGFQRFTQKPKHKHAIDYLAPSGKQLGHSSVVLAL